VIEANATGCVAVASDSPGLKESVRHEETGLLVPHGDVPALADALTRLLRDDELLVRMSRNALAWAAEFHWDRSTRETLDLIERVLAERPLPAAQRDEESAQRAQERRS
jgi:glycosyltransferase involved in cell wall biosynthesis